MDKYPLISIVIPSFNQGKFIERSIKSVLDQKYPNIELIVIDGGSKDETIEIIKKYDDRIAYWESTPDRGQSHALNKGFRNAHGEIYGWLNSDDLYVEGAFYTAVEIFLNNTLKMVVFGDYDVIDENDNRLEYVFAFDFSIKHFVYEGFHLNAQACFWRSSLHSKFGEFDESLYRTMDYDMLLRFGLIVGQSNFIRVGKSLACFRRHKYQKTQGFDEKVQKEQRFIANKLNFPLKNSSLFPLLRFIYRFRRIYWYMKRGGFNYTMEKILSGKLAKRVIGIISGPR